MRLIEARLRETGGAQAVLIADHQQGIAGLLQFQQCRDHVRHQAQLLQAVDLVVGWLFDERTVAIDEQYTSGYTSGLGLSVHAACPLASAMPRTRRAFCSGVPIDTRRQLPRPTCER